MSGVTSNTTRRVRTVATLPASCGVGEVRIKTGANAGFYICLVADTWTGPFDTSADTGDFTGPASSTDNALVRFDGAGGKTGQNSLATVDDNGSVNIPSGQTYKINNVALPQQAAVDAKANDADVVHDTGDETIAGVKTFSSDPIIPDEAYGVGWNGSLEPPTKNAVYDKIVSLAAADLTDYAATTWVPTWTNVTVGDGTVTATYLRIGKSVICELTFVLGSTSAISGNVIFSLPLTSAAYPGVATTQPLGDVNAFDNGTNVFAGTLVWATTTTAALRFHTVTGASVVLTQASSTAPFTWVAGDEIHVTFRYRLP